MISGVLTKKSSNSIRRFVPFKLRCNLKRLRRAAVDIRDLNRTVRKKGDDGDFPCTLFSDSSPLSRDPGMIPVILQRGKEANIAIACRTIDRVVARPGEMFSYHRLVGWPLRLRGFQEGLELHDGEKTAGVGGGLCLVSNLLYWLALCSGMIIRERHRHSFDLFPDKNRTRPFGCGATVFYNYHDLRFENPLPSRVMFRMGIENGRVVGWVLTEKDLGYSIEIQERGHRFFKENGVRMRENFIWRQIRNQKGTLLREELIAHNLCKVMYGELES